MSAVARGVPPRLHTCGESPPRAFRSGHAGRVSVVALLEDLGGVATRGRPLRKGQVVAIARGRYCLPSVDEATQLAHAIGGVLSHSSAALYRGWQVRQVRHGRTSRCLAREVDPELARRAILHFRDLMPDEITDGIATSAELTLEQSLRSLPGADALCIADSALRHGTPPSLLRRVAVRTWAGDLRVLHQ